MCIAIQPLVVMLGQLCDDRVEDDTNHCYGLAFVMLAYSCGLKVGIKQAREWMDETWCLLERHFWDAEYGLYKDEADAQWNFTRYRGQNAKHAYVRGDVGGL